MTETRYQSITTLHENANTPKDRVEMTTRVLDDLDATGQALDALVYLDRGFALHQAEQPLSLPDHPLAGVPLAHKELYNRQGWPDEGGSKPIKARSQQKPPIRSPNWTAVARLIVGGLFQWNLP